MTPVALLVAFCVTMAAIAVGRLAVDSERDHVDVGSALVIVGISLLATLWATLEVSLLSLFGRVLLATLGGITVCAGLVLIVRYWDEPPNPNASCD